jgi:hypothetical protein
LKRSAVKHGAPEWIALVETHLLIFGDRLVLADLPPKIYIAAYALHYI